MTFDNKSELEQALIKIITNLIGKTSDNYIPIYTIGERFDRKDGKAITSSNSFELKKTGNIWQVAVISEQ